MTYDPNARAKTSPDPYGRKVGESYRDACERMVGQLRAQEIDLARLRAMEKRAEECSTWCGLDGMHRAVTYIRTGEVPELGRRFIEEREPCGRQSATCSRPDDCRSCHPWERR